jgi:hypothetical protein
MQAIYLGNQQINAAALGNLPVSDIRLGQPIPSLVTESLSYYFDAAISASSANWRSVVPYGNRTGSLFQTTYTAVPPQFNLNGAVADINFGTVPNEIKQAPYTIIIVAKQKNDVGTANLTWFGNSSLGPNNFLQTSGSVGSSKFIRVATNVTSSVATTLSYTLNEYHQVAMTVSGSTFGGVSVWVDDNKQSLSGSGQFASQSLSIYWVIGTENSQNPLSGSVLAYCVYNRVLSDSEILKNYAHFKARF